MLRNQMVTLDETGKELLKKASVATRSSDVREFTELGLKCLAESRQIASQLRANSLLLFLECQVNNRTRPDYLHYTDFCARNNLEMFMREDFDSILCSVDEAIKKDPA